MIRCGAFSPYTNCIMTFTLPISSQNGFYLIMKFEHNDVVKPCNQIKFKWTCYCGTTLCQSYFKQHICQMCSRVCILLYWLCLVPWINNLPLYVSTITYIVHLRSPFGAIRGIEVSSKHLDFCFIICNNVISHCRVGCPASWYFVIKPLGREIWLNNHKSPVMFPLHESCFHPDAFICRVSYPQSRTWFSSVFLLIMLSITVGLGDQLTCHSHSHTDIQNGQQNLATYQTNVH